MCQLLRRRVPDHTNALCGAGEIHVRLAELAHQGGACCHGLVELDRGDRLERDRIGRNDCRVRLWSEVGDAERHRVAALDRTTRGAGLRLHQDRPASIGRDRKAVEVDVDRRTSAERLLLRDDDRSGLWIELVDRWSDHRVDPAALDDGHARREDPLSGKQRQEGLPDLLARIRVEARDIGTSGVTRDRRARSATEEERLVGTAEDDDLDTAGIDMRRQELSNLVSAGQRTGEGRAGLQSTVDRIRHLGRANRRGIVRIVVRRICRVVLDAGDLGADRGWIALFRGGDRRRRRARRVARSLGEARRGKDGADNRQDQQQAPAPAFCGPRDRVNTIHRGRRLSIGN